MTRSGLGAVLATLAILLVGVPYSNASGHHDSNVWIEWIKEGQTPVSSPFVGYEVQEGGRIGCTQAVRVTFTSGHVRTLVGFAFGPNACDYGYDACFPYTELYGFVECEPDRLVRPIRFEVPANVDGNLAELELGCLKEFWVNFDYDGDGNTNQRDGPFFGFANCEAGN